MFLIKMIGNGVIVVGLLMLLGDATWIGALGTALALTVIAYMFGDLVVLPLTNNWIATAVDGVLAFILLWGISGTALWNHSLGDILVITLVLGMFEYFFHSMLYRTDYFRGERKIRI
ncbi:DUF2512 family protein [Paenibacillus sp. DMB20]|uniref:DUF2512 family protein n=1 Tax=Paenibacillus sp. DMB20 TaxID=1642570 RepID=UPI000627955B|nr:DUF2512 family protein [Paenibacillus sp. DMB20]KKO53647.1 hypothetical protein XI25_11665 [Paenibacillus sp. DMB20]